MLGGPAGGMFRPVRERDERRDDFDTTTTWWSSWRWAGGGQSETSIIDTVKSTPIGGEVVVPEMGPGPWGEPPGEILAALPGGGIGRGGEAFPQLGEGGGLGCGDIVGEPSRRRFTPPPPFPPPFPPLLPPLPPIFPLPRSAGPVGLL